MTASDRLAVSRIRESISTLTARVNAAHGLSWPRLYCHQRMRLYRVLWAAYERAGVVIK